LCCPDTASGVAANVHTLAALVKMHCYSDDLEAALAVGRRVAQLAPLTGSAEAGLKEGVQANVWHNLLAASKRLGRSDVVDQVGRASRCFQSGGVSCCAS
jgi:hypothetical protein